MPSCATDGMECPAPGSACERSARITAQVTHGVDLEHRCDLRTCRFVVSPERLRFNGRPARVAVCKTGLHVHWCGTGVCKLAVQEARLNGGPWVCPISKLEVTGQAEVYCPQRVRGTGGQPDKFVHAVGPVRRRRSSRKSRNAETRRYIAMLLASKESEALIQAAAQRRERLVASAVLKAGSSFMAQMKAARAVSPRAGLPHVDSEMLTRLATAVDNFLERIRVRLTVCKGNASQVAAVVGFLAVGLKADGVTVFPKVPWISDRLPAAADLGKLPGFQCRPVSISARHIKGAIFGGNGKPIASLLFRWARPDRCNNAGQRKQPGASGAADAGDIGAEKPSGKEAS